MRKPGRHFLQIPGPSTVPDRVLRAIDFQTMDHRSPEFGDLGRRALDGMKTIFGTASDVIIYPASGTGAWEAALVNTLSPGDRVLMCETGQFARLWNRLSARLGLEPEVIETDWRQAADVAGIEARLRADTAHEIKAVCVVHNETSTGCTSDIAAVRAAIDAVGHPALLMVDTISSLGSVDYRHDDWGVDVTVGGSQKGLMLPPGLSFNAVSEKAKTASRDARLPRSFWDWDEMIAANKTGYFPYTPATNMLYGLVEALDMLHEEGLAAVYARHARHGAATRRAVEKWGLEVLCRVPEHYSPVLTAVMVPEGHSADNLRRIIHTELNMSLGNGLGRLQDRVFRIGHLGDFNDLMLLGTLSGIEIGLSRAEIPHKKGGVQAAIDFLTVGSNEDVAHRAA
ncbi:MAG: aminotransferase class V-fold PLP-dependent enzyme [Rhodobacteraceae bacterium]|nr:aminotransferase class V-fold PLP-dependent enzyme [Paracoccaceae bacterium]